MLVGNATLLNMSLIGDTTSYSASLACDVAVGAAHRELLGQRVDGHANALPRQNDGCRRAEYIHVFDDCLHCEPACAKHANQSINQSIR